MFKLIAICIFSIFIFAESCVTAFHNQKPGRALIVVKEGITIIDTLMQTISNSKIETFNFLENKIIEYIVIESFYYFYIKQRYGINPKTASDLIDHFSLKTFVPRPYETRPHVDHSFKFISASMVRMYKIKETHSILIWKG